MLANVNATRMELLQLRRRVALAARGHHLLSEKRDEISRQLIKIARQISPLRKKAESELLQTFRSFMMARATMEPEDVRSSLEVPTKKFSLVVNLANIANMSLDITHLRIEIE